MNTFKKLLFVISVLLCFSFMLESCTSPAKRGKHFAENENEIFQDFQKEIEKLIDSYASDFRPENYSLRQEAKDEWLSRHADIVRLLTENIENNQSEIKAYVSDLSNDEQVEFMKTYRQTLNTEQNNKLWQQLKDTTIPPEVLHSISLIKPQKPNETQMAKDLEKMSLNDVEGGYYYETNQTIQISDYNINNLKITDIATNTSTEYTVKASMSLLGKVNKERRIDIICTIRYLLPEYDDWSIDFIKTETLTPVSADAYSGCVKLIISGGWLMQYLYVKNVCSKPLEVFVRYYEYKKWHKKVVVAKPQEDTFVSYNEPDEYKIDYVLPL